MTALSPHWPFPGVSPCIAGPVSSRARQPQQLMTDIHRRGRAQRAVVVAGRRSSGPMRARGSCADSIFGTLLSAHRAIQKAPDEHCGRYSPGWPDARSEVAVQELRPLLDRPGALALEAASAAPCLLERVGSRQPSHAVRPGSAFGATSRFAGADTEQHNRSRDCRRRSHRAVEGPPTRHGRPGGVPLIAWTP